jgi:hypothetical protein
MRPGKRTAASVLGLQEMPRGRAGFCVPEDRKTASEKYPEPSKTVEKPSNSFGPLLKRPKTVEGNQNVFFMVHGPQAWPSRGPCAVPGPQV